MAMTDKATGADAPTQPAPSLLTANPVYKPFRTHGPMTHG